jgi:hypothetical protein
VVVKRVVDKLDQPVHEKTVAITSNPSGDDPELAAEIEALAQGEGFSESRWDGACRSKRRTQRG